MPLDEMKLLPAYKQHLDVEARNELINQHSDLVKIIAASLYKKRFDDEIEFDDYYQFGLIGLIESIDRYEPDRGASFNTFASHRIRGAILNGLEKHSERRQQSAFRSRLLKERMESIAAPDEHETSSFESLVDVALGMAICFMLDDTGLVQSPGKANHVYEEYELFHLKMRLLRGIDRLPEKDRLIIKYHYFEHVDFSEIAEKIAVSRGRVSQLHKRALSSLRELLKDTEFIDECY